MAYGQGPARITSCRPPPGVPVAITPPRATRRGSPPRPAAPRAAASSRARYRRAAAGAPRTGPGRAITRRRPYPDSGPDRPMRRIRPPPGSGPGRTSTRGRPRRVRSPGPPPPPRRRARDALGPAPGGRRAAPGRLRRGRRRRFRDDREGRRWPNPDAARAEGLAEALHGRGRLGRRAGTAPRRGRVRRAHGRTGGRQEQAVPGQPRGHREDCGRDGEVRPRPRRNRARGEAARRPVREGQPVGRPGGPPEGGRQVQRDRGGRPPRPAVQGVDRGPGRAREGQPAEAAGRCRTKS